MRIISAILSCLILTTVHAQTELSYNKFQWSPTATLHKVNPAYAGESAVFVLDERIQEYISEKNGFFGYHTVHKIVHINDDKGIESFNKIYLPFGEGIEITDVKARTVLPNGKVIELDKNNIKDIKDDEGQYKIFALDGLTKGCEVEYYYTQKKDPSLFGREVMGSGLPVMKAHFELVSDPQLIFEAKSFNALPAPVDTVLNGKRYVSIDDENIAGLDEEKYSMYRANLKRVEYKLSYNKSKSAVTRLFTWSELAKKVYALYADIDEKEQKKINELLSRINPKGTDADKIMMIENFMKKEFITKDDIDDGDLADLGKVIKNKIASNKALCKIFIGLFNGAGIGYQVVLSGDRSEYAVDKSFENWNNTKHVLLYFPSTRKYIAPTEVEYRYPFFDPTWGATYGLFCIGTTIGSFTTALGEVKMIQLEDTKYSFSNMSMKLKFEKDDALMVDCKQSYGGYFSSNYRLPFNYMPADEQKKVLKEMVKFGTNSENIIQSSFENKEMEQTDPYKPFVINATVKSTTLVERAGDKLIVKIGETIGQQQEMYEDKPRGTNIELSFPHSLVRDIELIIPDGYKVKDLSPLNINVVGKEGDVETMGFTSAATMTGNILKVHINEVYNKILYTKDQYEQFKKVINASADFNKIVLILEKN